MLEALFGSRARAKIIKFFCTHNQERFYLRELARSLDLAVNSLSRELDNLEQLGFLSSHVVDNKKYYFADENWPLLSELRALIIKSTVLLEKVLVNQLQRLSNVRALFLTGVFIDQPLETDILLVGAVNRKQVQKLINSLSKSFYQDLRFTLLSSKEYVFRLEVGDKFVTNILNQSPVVIVDKFSQ